MMRSAARGGGLREYFSKSPMQALRCSAVSSCADAVSRNAEQGGSGQDGA